MILSIFAVQPYWEVTIQQGEVTRRCETQTFSTLLSRMSFITLHKAEELELVTELELGLVTGLL